MPKRKSKKNKYRPMKMKKRLRLWRKRLWEICCDKWPDFINEPRSITQRIVLVLFPVLLFSFAFLFWGAMYTVVQNQGIIAISPIDVFAPLFVVFTITTILGTGVLLLLRGVFLDAVISIVCALAVAGWVQVSFLNRNMGLIDGDDFIFTIGQIIVNLIIWAAILITIIAMRWIKKSVWTRSVIFISALLFLMQFVSFISVIPRIRDSERRSFSTGYFLSMDYEFMMSSNENTLVFVLDAMSFSRFDVAVNEFPHLHDIFRDFTMFENSATSYDGTFPSMPFLLTNHRFDFTRPTREYLGGIWEHPKTLELYDAVREAGYRFHLFTSPGGVAVDARQLEGIVDNFIYGELGEINTQLLRREMINLSAFRHAPLFLKRNLVPYDGNFYHTVSEFSGYAFTVLNDILLYQRLTTQGLWVQDNYNVLLVNHMRGSHMGGGAGANMDEFANHTPNSTPARQTAGSLWIVGEYIRQMQRLGIYDNSNIIIMADHGAGLRPSSVFLIKQAGEQRDYMGISQAPISHTDFWPTLAYIMRLNNLDLGRSVFDIPEDEERERTLTSWLWYADFANTHHTYNAVAIQSFTGHVSDIAPFIQGGRRQESGFIERFPHIPIYPIYDSFYGGNWERHDAEKIDDWRN